MNKKEIHLLRSELHIPLQTRTDEEYLLNPLNKYASNQKKLLNNITHHIFVVCSVDFNHTVTGRNIIIFKFI